MPREFLDRIYRINRIKKGGGVKSKKIVRAADKADCMRAMQKSTSARVDSTSKLRVQHAVVRFDAVPKNVASEVLERTCLDDQGDILEWEYNFIQSIPAAAFWRKLEEDVSGWLGREIRRLRKCKLLPVLYVDIAPRRYHMFYVQIFRSIVRKLAMKKSAFVLCRKDREDSSSVVEIPESIIALLARNRFNLEIS